MGAQESVADLVRRIASFSNASDRAAVLDRSALAAAIGLLAELGPPGDNENAAAFCVVAMFLLCHAQAGGEAGVPGALSQMLTLRLVELAESGLVPEWLRPLTDAVLRDMMLDSRARHGLGLLQHGVDEGDAAALDAGIETVRAVLAESGGRLAICDPCWYVLSMGLWERFRLGGGLGDLDEAISVGTDAFESSAGRDRARFAVGLAAMLFDRYGESGHRADLEQIVGQCQGEADRFEAADELGIELRGVLRDARLALFEATGNLAELEETIGLGETLIANVKGERRAPLLAAQAEALIARANRRGASSDRDVAIALRREAVDELSSGAGWFHNILMLRDQLMRRWQEEARPPDADELITIDIAVMPELTNSERAMLLPSHIRLLWDRLDRHGSDQDLNMIIEAAREVCRLHDRPDSGDQSNLCYFLQLRYGRTRDLSDLEEAVVVGRRSVQDPSAGPEKLATHLSNLFRALSLLSEATESLDAANEAVEIAERAVCLFPSDSPNRTPQLANLTTGLWGRFQATGNRDDLERAITSGQQALDASRPDDPGLDNLGASLVAALTLKFSQFDDDSALDQALAVFRRAMHPSLGWLESLNGLLDCLSQRIERESAPGLQADEDRAAALARYRQVQHALFNNVQKCLVLISTEMMGAGAAGANVDLINGALDLIDQAAGLGDAERRALYRGLRGECLIRRWQITSAREDLDTAIDCLIDAATGPSDTDTDSALAGHHAKSAATALVRRFRRRRNAADLQEAERLLERATALLPTSETELHAEIQTLHNDIRGITASAPFLIVQSDVGEADREDLSSPYGAANLLAWNEGKPRFSGLTWFHTREEDAGSSADLGGDELMAGRRVLLLRTFLDDDTNFVILNSLALALDNNGHIELVGDSRDRSLIEKHWQRAFGTDAVPKSRVDFNESTAHSWRRDVLDLIYRADAIVLFISPKDADFPEFPFLNTSTKIGEAGNWERFMSAPLAQPLTGPGLLREICYLNRLQRLQDTVVVCDQRYQPALDDLIALGGMMGDAMDMAGNLVTPKLTASDKQVGQLWKAFRGITYHRPDNSPIMPSLAHAVREAVRQVFANGKSPGAAPWTPQDLCGTSPYPRRLPPDNELKVIPFSNVENVYFIPSGEIIQIDHREMLGILSREATRTGCPYCRAPIEQMFFYRRGLEKLAVDNSDGPDRPNAKCQRCGHKSSLFGNDTLWPQ